jgi:hypothetical protein
MSIFEIVSKLNKEIRLTEIQWVHIRYKHPELNNQIKKIILTIQSPDFIYYSLKEDNYHYYKNFKHTPVTEKYLLAVVKHLNKEGFVITAFFISKVRKIGKEVVHG